MAKIIREADDVAVDLVHEVLAEEYPAIASLDPPVRIGVLFVGSDDGKPAITHGGYPAAAVIRVVSEEDRAAGGPDAILSIDFDRWLERPDAERRALVHHELHHVVPVKLRAAPDGGHTCDLDSLGRPKVKLRRHDFEIGGFRCIVERYRDDAIEWQQVTRVHEAFHQQTLPFVQDIPEKKTRKA